MLQWWQCGITLITKDRTLVVQGNKIHNHLYCTKMVVRTPTYNTQSHQTFIGNNSLPTLETWHQCFGHTGYTGLQKLLDRKMVDGFIVDKDSPKPDCVACTEVKQHIEPFPKTSIRKTEPGELTHIDLWINGHQYYLLFVDDAMRSATVECIKKSDAVQAIINYLVHLKTQERNPKGIQIDHGKEFVNEKLEN